MTPKNQIRGRVRTSHGQKKEGDPKISIYFKNVVTLHEDGIFIAFLSKIFLASNMLELLYVHQEGAEVYYNCSKMHASLPGHSETRVACIFQAKITPPFARLNFLLEAVSSEN
jgi:hypothetical protein